MICTWFENVCVRYFLATTIFYGFSVKREVRDIETYEPNLFKQYLYLANFFLNLHYRRVERILLDFPFLITLQWKRLITIYNCSKKKLVWLIVVHIWVKCKNNLRSLFLLLTEWPLHFHWHPLTNHSECSSPFHIQNNPFIFSLISTVFSLDEWRKGEECQWMNSSLFHFCSILRLTSQTSFFHLLRTCRLLVHYITAFIAISLLLFTYEDKVKWVGIFWSQRILA